MTQEEMMQEFYELGFNEFHENVLQSLKHISSISDSGAAYHAYITGITMYVGNLYKNLFTDKTVAEHAAVCCIRGAVRGLDGPVDEWGTMFPQINRA